jgi:hypothetical protein
MKKLSTFIASTVFFITAHSAYAGSNNEGPLQYQPESIIAFSKQVEKELAKKGARVAIVGRMGRPKKDLPEGISYTHIAFAVYSEITTQDNRKLRGYAMHNLYQRNDQLDVSDLVLDYPVDFFAGVAELEAGIILLTPEMQSRVLSIINSPTYKQLHNPNYSVIANPYTLELQNCTEHTLDIATAAIYQTDDIRTIKANLKAYFKAQPIKINPLKLAIGSMISADVTTSDQPGKPQTATYDTIAQFLIQYGAATESYTLKPSTPPLRVAKIKT